MIIVVYNQTDGKREDIIYIKGKEAVPCPICGGSLKVHGSCCRKLQIARKDTVIYHLRVMECRNCGRTHRELPDGMIPYKRMSSDYFTEIATTPSEAYLTGPILEDVEASTWRKSVAWMHRFIQYVRFVLASVRLPPLPETFFIGDLTAGQTEHFVRLVVNSGLWTTASFGLAMPF